MNKIDLLTRSVGSQIDIKYNLNLRILTLNLYYGFYYKDNLPGKEKNTSELFELLIKVYDPEGKGYRFVTPFLVDKALEFPKNEMDGLTSKLIPESFQPPPLSTLSAKKLGDKIRQEHLDKVDMANYRWNRWKRSLANTTPEKNKRKRVQTTSEGYLFTQIQ